MGAPVKYLKNVATLSYDKARCTGCGRCVEVCPHGVFEMSGGKASIRDRDLCMECGACSLNCDFSAIAVTAGVGCATALINGMITGNESCGCGGDAECC